MEPTRLAAAATAPGFAMVPTLQRLALALTLLPLVRACSPPPAGASRAHVAVLRTRSGPCAAAAVAPRWLLTSAACVGDGVEAAESGDGGGEGSTVGAKTVERHPQYEKGSDGGLAVWDVALVELKAELEGVDVVAVNENVDGPEVGQTVRAAGYERGAAGDGAEALDGVQMVDAPVVSTGECSKVLKGEGEELKGRIHVCAGFRGDSCHDGCYFEGGGPVVVRADGGKVVQVGVTHLGINCLRDGAPGVYTRVAAVLDWIDEVVGAGVVERISVGGRDRTIDVNGGADDEAEEVVEDDDGGSSTVVTGVAGGLAGVALLITVVGCLLFARSRRRKAHTANFAETKLDSKDSAVTLETSGPSGRTIVSDSSGDDAAGDTFIAGSRSKRDVETGEAAMPVDGGAVVQDFFGRRSGGLDAFLP